MLPFFYVYIKLFFFTLFCLPIILDIFSAIRKMKIKELRDFIYENYYSQIGFIKENSYYLIKRQKKKIYNCLQQN